jgi:hypothetical protein
VDLIVRPNHAGRLKRLLWRMGYLQGCWLENSLAVAQYDAIAIAQHEAAHFELATFTKVLTAPAEDPRPFRRVGID